MFQIQDQFSDENDAAQQRIDELRHELPDPPATWRSHEGGWQRWSWLDSEFREAPVPAALVAFVEGKGGIVDDEVLVFVEAEWRPESPDELAARVHRHDPVDLGQPDDLGQAVRHDAEETPQEPDAGDA
jgi:hypothetical protein